MRTAVKGALIGGLFGLFTGVSNPNYTVLTAGLVALTCGAIGWMIGRYMEMRKPRR